MAQHQKKLRSHKSHNVQIHARQLNPTRGTDLGTGRPFRQAGSPSRGVRSAPSPPASSAFTSRNQRQENAFLCMCAMQYWTPHSTRVGRYGMLELGPDPESVAVWTWHVTLKCRSCSA
eukprot:3661004-Rhodomonas_salina.1